MKGALGLLFLTLLISCQKENHPSVMVAFEPQTVIVDGKVVLYYELDIANPPEDSIHISSIQIYGDGDFLIELTFPPVARVASEISGTLPHTTTFYIELPVAHASGKIQLTHRFIAALADGERKFSFESDPVDVTINRPIVIGAPLREGTWAAVNDPSWERGHRRVRFREDSKEFLPGRFAIDFIRLDSGGRYAEKDENEIANWFGYANEVLAVEDGIVVGSRDDFAESPTLDAHPRYPQDKATGNYIAIEIAPSVVVFYEHLKPGSIGVQMGQRVSKGDVIAKLGFTGQSTGPHLHLHVANDSAPLLSQGIAFVLDEFEMVGRYDDFSVFGKERWHGEPASRRRGERPPVNSVVRFGD